MNRILADYQALERQAERDSEAVRIARAVLKFPPIFPVPNTFTMVYCWFCTERASESGDMIQHTADCPITLARAIVGALSPNGGME